MYQFAAVQHTGNLTAFFEKFKRTERALKVDETEVILTNAFIDIISALESGKNQKMT